MNEYYEYYRSGKEGFMIKCGELQYPLHFHQNLELCIMLTGEQDLCVGGKHFHAVAPCIIVIDNFIAHSYGEGNGMRCALIIPHEMITEFNRIRHGKAYTNICIYDTTLVENVMYIVNNYLKTEGDYYRISSAVNMIMSLILHELSLVEADRNNESELINRILTFIQNNFKENISLKSTARALGYAEGHLSRVFHKYINESFPCYINRLRLEYVQNRLDSGENVTKLIFDAGFRSLQTYYRTKNRLKI